MSENLSLDSYRGPSLEVARLYSGVEGTRYFAMKDFF